MTYLGVPFRDPLWIMQTTDRTHPTPGYVELPRGPNTPGGPWCG
jgi:hypothetical protein